MTLHVDTIEALWFAITLAGLIVCVAEAVDARQARNVIHSLNGRAREIDAGANLRRAVLRATVQALLLSLVFPSLFTDFTVQLDYGAVTLIAVSFVLLLSSSLDLVDRNRVIRIASDEVEQDRMNALAKLELIAADAKARDESQGRMEATVEDTHEKVVEMHDKLTP